MCRFRDSFTRWQIFTDTAVIIVLLLDEKRTEQTSASFISIIFIIMHCSAVTQHTPTHIFLSVSLAAQILTAHFRQMEQELAEAVKQREEERQQWAERANGADAEMAAVRISLEALSAEVAKQESELVFLRQAEHVSQEALEKEKVEVARLERELALMKEAELVAVQASQDAAEGDRAELVRLENELAFMRDKVDCASRDASEREKSEVEKLEQELASLKEEREDAQKKQEILTEIWRHLQPLAAEDVQREEECPLPADHSLFLHTVHSVETQLMKLKEECNNSREHCVELTHAMETLQGKRMYLVEIQCVNLTPLVFNTKIKL